MRNILSLLTIVSLTLFSSCQDVKIEKPNVLLISIDDLNNWIEPMGGHPQAKTPYLSKFAEEAMVFQNAYCASPSCNPSRTALMTGKSPWITGLYNNPQIWRHVVGDESTLPEHFREAGYWTGGAGKIFHNNMPDPRSWDAYYPSKIQHFPYYYLPEYDSVSQSKIFTKQDNEIREDDPKGVTFTMPPFQGMYVAFDFHPLPYSTEETGDYSSVKWVSEQLQKEHDKPFFLACGIYRPHVPWYVPEEFYDKFPIDSVLLPITLETDWDDLPEEAKRTARGNYHKKIVEADLWKEAVQGYLSSINFADQLVGQLLAELDKSAYGENTVVVIFSDHGWQLGEKSHWRKFALWNNVINSVLLIKAPKGIPGLPEGNQSLNCFANVSLMDIFPTLTELCGIPSKEQVSGLSLVPLLQNPKNTWNHPVISSLGDKHFSVKLNEWHYINYNGRGEELYNLKEDPEEWTNLAIDPGYAEKLLEMKNHIPVDRHELVNTKSLRWADVLSGKTNLYKED